MWGFQANRRPPERLVASIAQNFQEGRSLEKANKAGKELHMVSWRRTISELRELKRVRRQWSLALPPRPLTLRETIFMDHLVRETVL